jgi:hypothetical protein
MVRVKRIMENVVVSRRKEQSIGPDAKKFLIMRTLARLHECDEEALLLSIDSTEAEIHQIMGDMVSKDEVEASPPWISKGKRRTTFALTLNGWGGYLNALGSVYELPE